MKFFILVISRHMALWKCPSYCMLVIGTLRRKHSVIRCGFVYIFFLSSPTLSSTWPADDKNLVFAKNSTRTISLHSTFHWSPFYKKKVKEKNNCFDLKVTPTYLTKATPNFNTWKMIASKKGNILRRTSFLFYFFFCLFVQPVSVAQSEPSCVKRSGL